MKAMRITLTIMIFIIILLVLTFVYQYQRANKNILTILELRSASETIDQVELLSNYTLSFSNQILEGVVHSRSALYLQMALFVLMLALEFNWLTKRKNKE
jgi:hypothetical protein